MRLVGIKLIWIRSWLSTPQWHVVVYSKVLFEILATLKTVRFRQRVDALSQWFGGLFGAVCAVCAHAVESPAFKFMF